MDLIEIMLMCSILCSSDIIAAVTIIKYENQPKLFSIILGEGLANDAVAIVLYQTMNKFMFEKDLYYFKPTTPFLIIGDFCRLFSLSIVVGLFFGFSVSYMTKKMRFLA